MDIILNGTLCALLCWTLFRMIRMQRMIKLMQKTKDEYGQLVTEFSDSLTKAQLLMEEVRSEVQRAEYRLERKMQQAEIMCDELGCVIRHIDSPVTPPKNKVPREPKVLSKDPTQILSHLLDEMKQPA